VELYYQQISSPVCALVIAASESSLFGLVYACHWAHFAKKAFSLKHQPNPLLTRCQDQLTEYFEGTRCEFDLPYQLNGSPFQRQAWEALAEIPYGETVSYKQQASAINAPNAVRAVGRANGLNPLCIILPCHRVVGSNGSLTGYAGGLAAKQLLLKLEQASGYCKQ